jgi:hypothetical protein
MARHKEDCSFLMHTLQLGPIEVTAKDGPSKELWCRALSDMLQHQRVKLSAQRKQEKTMATAGGAVAGAVLGTMLLPGVGTLLGAAAGAVASRSIKKEVDRFAERKQLDPSSASSSSSSSSSSSAAALPMGGGGNECHICAVEFGMFVRSHYCRNCGFLVCAAHSDNTAPLPHATTTTTTTTAGSRDEAVRVCDVCFHASLAFYKELRTALRRHTSIFTSTASDPHPQTVVDILKASRSRQIQRDRQQQRQQRCASSGGGGGGGEGGAVPLNEPTPAGFFSLGAFRSSVDSGDGSSIMPETVCSFPFFFVSLSLSLQ